MSNPILKSVCRAMERIAPLRLAESWDNVWRVICSISFPNSQYLLTTAGWFAPRYLDLLRLKSLAQLTNLASGSESPTPIPTNKRVLLTIDLTTSVLNEAVANKSSVIVSYHPPIFKGLKSLTMTNPLQTSLLKCVAQGISIYSPHTALDSVWGGVNDWLAHGVLGGEQGAITSLIQDKVSPTGEIEGGEGRLVTLHAPIALDVLEKRIKAHLKLPQIQVGYGHSSESSGTQSLVKSIAICAGSGGSMLASQEADVYFTGEMSHHEALAAVAAGKHVILCGHTNTERGYLPHLASKLSRELAADEALANEPVEVVVSQQDRHPLQFV